MIPAFVVQPLVQQALMEDLGQGDVTSSSLFPAGSQNAQASIVAREPLVVSGLTVARQVFQTVDPTLRVELIVRDGEAVSDGDALLTVSGDWASILQGERVALNFLQHLCGVATTTKLYVEALFGTFTKLAHTRKTTPGLRLLEQQAVIHGGGKPHRYNLGSCAFVKDNHLSEISISKAVERLRSKISHTQTIVVECDTLVQVGEATEAKADVILLDNMAIEILKQAVVLIRQSPNPPVIEASGGITLASIRSVAETGVDVISTSAITLGARAVDLGLDALVKTP